MPLPQYDRSPSHELSQQRLKTVFDQLLRLPILEGRLAVGVALTGGAEVAVPHGLSRRPRGWMVVGNAPQANFPMVWETGTRDDRFLFLSAFYNVTVDLWIF